MIFYTQVVDNVFVNHLIIKYIISICLDNRLFYLIFCIPNKYQNICQDYEKHLKEITEKFPANKKSSAAIGSSFSSTSPSASAKLTSAASFMSSSSSAPKFGVSATSPVNSAGKYINYIFFYLKFFLIPTFDTSFLPRNCFCEFTSNIIYKNQI